MPDTARPCHFRIEEGPYPTAIFTYRTDEGRIAYHVARYQKGDGKKFLPWTFRDDGEWHPLGPEQRLLYNLHLLTNSPRALSRVIVVEGEKSADAAAKLFPDEVVTTSGGSTTAEKVDWTPIAGMPVVVFGQPDKPGRQYVADVIERCRNAGAVSIHEVDLGEVHRAHGRPLKHDWDVADLLEAGRDAAWMAEVLAKPGVLIEHAASRDGDWPPLLPLLPEVGKLPSFNVATQIPDALPEFRELLLATATAYQVPVDMPAMVAIAAVSLAIAGAVEVQPQPGWREPAAIWTATLMKPGERKSAVHSVIIEPIHAWMRQNEKALRQPIAQHEQKRTLMQKRREQLEGQAAKEKDETKRDESAQAALDLATQLAEMGTYKAPTLIASDATPEAIAELLHRNGEFVGVFSAEGAAIDVFMGRYSDKPNFGIYLSGHAGDACEIHRRGRDELRLERPQIAIGLAVQPKAVEEMLGNGDADQRGLLGRFMFVRPQTMIGRRALKPPPVPTRIGLWWSLRLHALLDLPRPNVVCQGPHGVMRSNAERCPVALSTAADDLFMRMRDDHEKRLSEGGDLDQVLGGWGSKLPGAIARIALSLHMLAGGEGPISGPTMAAAIAWAPYLIAHARALMPAQAVDADVGMAVRAVEWIQKNHVARITRRDLHRALERAGFKRSEDFVPVVGLLVSHGYVRPAMREKGRPGHPPEDYDVRPGL